MKIAVPVDNGVLDAHFGHCKSFAVLNVDDKEKKILSQESIDAPPHEPGLLPAWLGERDVNLVITGGMGQKARQLFGEQQIDVIVGAPVATPDKLVEEYLAGTLTSGQNACDH